MENLIIASEQNDIESVRKFLNDKNININHQAANGDTALIVSSRKNYTKITEILLKHKDIDVNLKNVNGETALTIACDNAHTIIIQQLLNHKSINIDDETKLQISIAVAELEQANAVIRNIQAGR
jgi:ankyrin repeat protein